MSVIIFAVIVVILLVLVLWLIRAIPNLPAPASTILQIVAILVAIILIATKARLI